MLGNSGLPGSSELLHTQDFLVATSPAIVHADYPSEKSLARKVWLKWLLANWRDLSLG
jgi:hypothetical protein